MKKTFTTFLVFAALSLGIKAQTTTWSFENLSDGTITENTPINGLEINASKVWTVEPNTKTFGTDQYTKRLKSGGGDRSLTFPVTGPGTIEIAALSSSTSEPERSFTIEGYTLFTKAEGDESTDYITMNYTGPATTLTLTTNAGINFYAIRYTPNGEKPVIRNKLWDLSTFYSATGEFTETCIKDGLVIYVGPTPEGSSKTLTMTWASSNKSFNIDGTKTKLAGQLKAGGDSKIDPDTNIPANRVIKFKPTSDGSISVGAITGSTGQDRNVIISKYNAGTISVLTTGNTNIVEGANGFEPFSTDYTYNAGDEIWIYADNNIQYWFVRFTGSVDPDFNGELSGISTNTIEFYPEIVISNKEIRVTEPVDMEIYAISGYKVAEQKNTTVITTQNMERGAYIVKCTSSKGKVVTKKFIK